MSRGKRAGAALLLTGLLALAGCGSLDAYLPFAREMEDMTLIRAMGMDLEGEKVKVTAAAGAQTGGEKGEKTPPALLSALSDTVSGAVLELQSYGDAYVFFGHVGELLLGEAMAREALPQALDYLARDVEMRLDTGFFVIRGTAAEAMTGSAGEDFSAADRLEALEDDTGLGGAVMKRSVRQVMADFGANGASFVPALAAAPRREGDGGEGEVTLVSAGYAILKEDGLVGWAAGDAALGVNLLLGEVEADVLALPGTPGVRAALRVVEAKTEVEPVFDGEELKGLAIRCRVEANVAQAPAGVDGGALAALEAALEETEERRLTAALAVSRGLGADFMGLKKRAGLAQPWRWAALREQWDGAFDSLELTVTVTGTVRRGYDLTD